MDQKKLTELIGMVLSDRRIQELIRSSLEADMVTGRISLARRELVLLETRSDIEGLLPEWKTYVCCQEVPEGEGALISFSQAAREEWDKIRFYRPSLNLIAKLAAGIADEPALKLIQEKLEEGSKDVELVCLDRIQSIKAEAYRKLFLGYLEKIRSFGIRTDEDCVADADRKSAGAGFRNMTPSELCSIESDSSWLNWQYKALTERDLLDVEKGAALKIGRKCIVTSLAEDMARRKSIRICREGEER